MILSILGTVQLSCKNLAGSKVDWFLQFKQNSGFGSVYMDSNARSSFQNSPPMTSSDNPTSMTLHNIDKYFVLEFND